MPKPAKPKLDIHTIVVDAKNTAWRSFYAYDGNLTANGMPTNVIHGFTLELVRLVADHIPQRVIVCWDSPSRFRRQIFPGYKNSRERVRAITDGTKRSFVMQVASLMGDVGLPWTHVQVDGIEGDDLVAHFADLYAFRGAFEKWRGGVLIVSGDRDFFQCVTPDISVFMPTQKRLITWDTFSTVAECDKVYFVSPDYYLRWKIVRGDAGDDIPSAIPKHGPAKALNVCGSVLLPGLSALTPATALALPSLDCTAPALRVYGAELARNWKLVSLAAARLIEQQTLREVKLTETTAHWPTFLDFCRKYRLRVVLEEGEASWRKLSAMGANV